MEGWYSAGGGGSFIMISIEQIARLRLLLLRLSSYGIPEIDSLQVGLLGRVNEYSASQ